MYLLYLPDRYDNVEAAFSLLIGIRYHIEMKTYEIRTFTDDDLLSLSMLQPVGWSDINRYYRWYLEDPFCYPIKVDVSGRLAAVGAAIVHGNTAWLGHIIVHPDFRLQGLGAAVTSRLIEDAGKLGCDAIQLIATDLGAPVYEKQGFRVTTEYLVYKDIELAEDPFPAVAFSEFRPADQSVLAQLDYAVAGEDRMVHVRPHLEAAVLVKVQDALQGYYLPTFGEGLIVAAVPAIGLTLLSYHLRQKGMAVFPKSNASALRYLSELGYKPTYIAKRMMLGREVVADFTAIYNRIGGNMG